MMFDDRRDAGKKLAEKLTHLRKADAVVLALPRGGVEIGAEIAHALSLPLDIIVTRKVGYPGHPEYAIGAVDEKGTVILNELEADALDRAWLAEEVERQKKEAARRLTRYRGNRPSTSLAKKIALIVDDGIATGLTMRLAVRIAREGGARKIIVGVPVAPESATAMLKKEGADEVIVLLPPEEFLGAVGAHYIDFPQLTDEEVVRFLSKAAV